MCVWEWDRESECACEQSHYFDKLLSSCTLTHAYIYIYIYTGNTEGGSITVPLTSCLTVLESAVLQHTIFIFISKTAKSKIVKQEVNCTVILPPSVFPVYICVCVRLGVFVCVCAFVCLCVSIKNILVSVCAG